MDGRDTLWVTRQKSYVDRCASAWLIKRFIDNEVVFQFITKEQKIPKGGRAFTLPKAEISPVEGVKTTFDVLMQKYDVNDLTVSQIGDIMRDYELNEETPEKLQLNNAGGLLRSERLGKNIANGRETVSKAFIIMDALYATMKNPA